MAEEIEFRFPSSLPYAYVNVRGTAEELANLDMEQVASLYANSMVGFRRYEQAALDYIASEHQRPADEPGGMTMEAAKLAPSAEEFKSEAEGLIALQKELGATEIDDVNAPPYKQPAPEVKAKPWETEKPAPKVVVDVDGW